MGLFDSSRWALRSIDRPQAHHDKNVDLLRRAAELTGARAGDGDFERILEHLPGLPSDQVFNVATPVLLLANAVGQSVVTSNIPSGMLGIFRAFATGTPDFMDLYQIQFTIRVNKAALFGLDSVRGPISHFLAPVQLWWPLFSNQQVEIIATNLTPARAIDKVTAMVRGTFFAR